jgi:hypothetical protein
LVILRPIEYTCVIPVSTATILLSPRLYFELEFLEGLIYLYLSPTVPLDQNIGYRVSYVYRLDCGCTCLSSKSRYSYSVAQLPIYQHCLRSTIDVFVKLCHNTRTSNETIDTNHIQTPKHQSIEADSRRKLNTTL